MIEFKESDGILAVYRNLAASTADISAELEARISHVYDAAELAAAKLIDGYGEDAVIAVLSEDEARACISEFIPSAEKVGVFGGGELVSETTERALRNFDVLYFCRALARKKRCSREELSEILLGGEPREEGKNEKKIALIRNAQASRAFEIFAAKLRDVMAAYEDNFADACEAVYENRAKYAIIPTSSGADGRLDGLYRTMEKYSLAVLMTCSVQSPDGNYTRFALAGRPTAESFSGGRTKFEMKITLASPLELSDIADAAAFFGATVDTLDSLPDIFGRGNAFALVFDVEDADAVGFLLYLSLKFSQFVTVGVYTHISEE